MKQITRIIGTMVVLTMIAGCGGGHEWVTPMTVTVSGKIYSAIVSGKSRSTLPSGISTRQTVSGEAVPDADVVLIRVDTGEVIQGPIRSGTDGSYRFTNVPLNISVRVVATKVMTGGTLKVEGIVPIVSLGEVKKDLNSVTTVAAQTLDDLLGKPDQKDPAKVKQTLEQLEAEIKVIQVDPVKVPDLRNDADVSSKVDEVVNVMGKITVTSNPSKASITLDGRETNLTTPFTLVGLREGNHTVSVTLTGYGSDSQSVTVKAKGDSPVHFDLKQRNVKITQVTITTDPDPMIYEGGTVTLSATLGDTTGIKSVVAVLTKRGGSTTIPTIVLTQNGNTFTGKYTAEANLNMIPDPYAVQFIAYDEKDNVVDKMMGTFEVPGVPSPPEGPWLHVK